MLSCTPRLSVLQVYWVGPLLGSLIATGVYSAFDFVDINEVDKTVKKKSQGKHDAT